MIPQDIIDRVNDLDIVSVIQGEGIELKRLGASKVCCCPFHNEKTPSLHVHTARNTWKCFGCGMGGNGISFIMELHKMRFPEAVKHLAKAHNIHFEERELTPEEKERNFRREQLININKAALAFYQKKLEESRKIYLKATEDKKTVPAAGRPAEYCEKRSWSVEILQEFGVGYAPKSGGLIEHLKSLGWKFKDMKDAGLAKENPDTGSRYDTFRERILFPIYDKYGCVCGFSGRYIGEGDGIAKYLNTGETEIFTKGKFLFGYYQGYREIATEETVFLVEGNPDAIRLHQIGKRNTVAPLGTALTIDQIRELQRRAQTVVIVGDTDDAGVKAVEKNGRLLLQNGLNVRVMVLPEGKDPDEYFQTRQHEFAECYANNTYDFIPWSAEKQLNGLTSQAEISKAIKEVAGLIANVRNESVVEMYLTDFSKSKKFPGGAIWRAEYNKAKAALERKNLKEEGAEDMAAEYGFYVRDNCYYGASDKGGNKRWSNFVLIPILHIRDEKNARRIFNMKNQSGQECVVKFNQSELVSFTDFKTRTESAGNFVWEAGQPELTTLKKYLYNGTASADEIRQLGWQKRYGFYAWGNGGLADGKFEAVDKFGIVTIRGNKYYLPGNALDTQDNVSGYQLMRKFAFTKTNDISLREFCERLITVFGDNAKVGISFLLATLFKDIVTSVTTSFPMLNLFGPKGTGKTQLGHALTSFFISDYIAPNINNTTKAALAEAVAEVSNALVHIDEYKNNLDLEKREFLKGLWDGAGRSRMNLDNDKRRETTAVDCGVILSGQEMPTADIALFNRLIFLTFTKSQFSDQEKKNFEELQLIEKRGLTHLTAEILQYRNQFQGKFRAAWDDAITDLNDKVRENNIEDRTLRNWAVVLSAFRCLNQYLDLPMSYDEMLNICAEMCCDQNAKTLQNNELSGFWNSIEILVTSRQIWSEIDYRIKVGNGRELKIKESKNPIILQQGKTYLFMSFNRIAQLYRKAARESDVKSIPPETLSFYLTHSSEFMGTVGSMRFKVPDTPQGYSASDSNKSKVTTAMIFDYDKIRELYGIDINVISGAAYEEEEEDRSPESYPVINFSDND